MEPAPLATLRRRHCVEISIGTPSATSRPVAIGNVIKPKVPRCTHEVVRPGSIVTADPDRRTASKHGTERSAVAVPDAGSACTWCGEAATCPSSTYVTGEIAPPGRPTRAFPPSAPCASCRYGCIYIFAVFRRLELLGPALQAAQKRLLAVTRGCLQGDG
jgi:hypothetical protein